MPRTPSTHPSHQDTKLLWTIAACLVAAALGITFLAGWRESDAVAPEPARVSAIPEASRERTPIDDGAIHLASYTEPASIGVEGPVVEVREVQTVEPGEPVDPEAGDTEPAVTLDPDADPVRAGLADYQSRDFARAAAYFERASEIRTDDAWVHYMHGLSLWKSGELDEAATALSVATGLAPGDVKAWINLSRVENDRGAFEAALAAAEQAVGVDPGRAKAWLLRARSLHNLGRTAQARADVEQAIALDPDDGHAHNLLGLMLIETERFAEAVPVLTRATELTPDVAYVHNNLGMALERSGDSTGALTAYRRAAELDPATGPASRNLARLETSMPESSPEPEVVTAEAPVQSEAAKEATEPEAEG